LSKRKRSRVRSTKRQVEDVPMTPMIDVVFQMLIYFVLTFEIPDKMSQMQVWRPAGQAAAEPSTRPPATITVYDGYFAYNDTRVSISTLERTFNQLADLDPTRPMIVIATADSRHRYLVEVLDILNKSGLENVSLLSSN